MKTKTTLLFVSSGNKIDGMSRVVKNQAISLTNQGLQVQFFTISGKGVFGYLRNVRALRKKIKTTKPDIVHAHYSMSGILTVMTGTKPHLVSLMGSEARAPLFLKIITKFFSKFFWKYIIVKSDEMKQRLGIKKALVIPNGVNTILFTPMNQKDCIIKLGLNPQKKHILFPASASRKEKNFKLAKEAVDLLKNPDIQIHTLENMSYEDVPIWMNAADVVLLTSLWEGSPNVIKEAMACCRPIVSTNVGDVKWLFGNETGHFIADFCPEKLAKTIETALEFSQNTEKTNGRKRIEQLKLSHNQVAEKIIKIYNTILIAD